MTPLEGVTTAIGTNLAEAAAFCLSKSGHLQGVYLEVTGVNPSSYQVTWPELPDNVSAARGDLKEATEDGASGIAILLARVHLGYEVVFWSHQGTGFDYLMQKIGSDADAIPARLEVSGIMKGNQSQIRGRIAEKSQQVKRGETTRDKRPAFVIVVEFSNPQAGVAAHDNIQ